MKQVNKRKPYDISHHSSVININLLYENLINLIERTKKMFRLIAIITLLGKHMFIKILISILKEYHSSNWFRWC